MMKTTVEIPNPKAVLNALSWERVLEALADSDARDLLRQMRRKGGLAGPPSDREARLRAKMKAGTFTDDDWGGGTENGLSAICQEQWLQMAELWQVEKKLIASLRLACCDVADERDLLFEWRAVRLAAHQAAVQYGRETLAPVESVMSKANIEKARRWTYQGKPWPCVLFDGSRPAFVSAEFHDYDEGNHQGGCLTLRCIDVCWIKFKSASAPRN